MNRRATRRLQSREPSAVGTLIYLMAGLIVWGVQFTVIYGGHVLLCLDAASAELADIFVIAATLLAAASLVAFVIWQGRAAALLGVVDGEWKAGCDRIARIVAVLSIIAALWSGWTVLLLDACAQAR